MSEAPLHALRSARGDVTCADVRGALLAAGCGDGALCVWRWRRGAGWTEARSVDCAHRYGVTAARWSDGGALLASAGVDGAARVWSRVLAERRVLGAPGAAAARAICWAASRLLVGHDDGALCVWAVRAGTLLVRITPCEGALHALAVLPCAALLLVACTTGTLKIFDFNEVTACGGSAALAAPLLWEDGAHDLGALCAAVSSAGDAATGGHDARVRLWRAGGAAGRVSAAGTLRGHAAAVTALCWARDGVLLASGSLDRTARLWATDESVCVRVLHAHARYLTCVVLSPDARYLVTGSNDRSLRTWVLGSFSLDDDAEPACAVLSHFALGDLEGIEPVYDDNPYVESIGAQGTAGGYGCDAAERVWCCEAAHDGAINAIATCEDAIITAGSDGAVRVFRWGAGGAGGAGGASAECALALSAHDYPALAVDVGAGGALLLSAGLDGRARLWDAQSGCELASVSGTGAPGAGAGSVAGGGGVRGARLSPHRPPLMLVATDDGALVVWSVQRRRAEPVHVYAPLTEAATCCAWASDGRLCAAGGAAGELRVVPAPPAGAADVAPSAPASPCAPCELVGAHDTGVLSCDFAPGVDSDETKYILATAGRDALLKIWEVVLEDDLCSEASVNVRLLNSTEAHGGAVESVRWGSDGVLLATSGADGWARVWLVGKDGSTALQAAVPSGSAAGASATALLGSSLLAVGSLLGELAVWQLPLARAHDAHVDNYEDDCDGQDEDACAEPRLWGVRGALRWLRDYVTRVPGAVAGAGSLSAAAERAAREHEVTGARLLDEPLDELLQLLAPAPKIDSSSQKKDEVETEEEHAVLRGSLRRELLQLRRGSPPGAVSTRVFRLVLNLVD